MTGRLPLALVMLACAAGVTSCETPSGVIKPRGTVSVSLDGVKKRGSITVALANLLAITMPPVKPGLVWQISYHDPRYLKQHSNFTAPTSPETGSTVSFVALVPGATRLRFLLVPADAGRSVDPVDQQEIIVTIR